jgi:hypothetical protein
MLRVGPGQLGRLALQLQQQRQASQQHRNISTCDGLLQAVLEQQHMTSQDALGSDNA